MFSIFCGAPRTYSVLLFEGSGSGETPTDLNPMTEFWEALGPTPSLGETWGEIRYLMHQPFFLSFYVCMYIYIYVVIYFVI